MFATGTAATVVPVSHLLFPETWPGVPGGGLALQRGDGEDADSGWGGFVLTIELFSVEHWMEKALGGGCDVGQGAEGDTGGEQTQVGNILTYLEPEHGKKNQPTSHVFFQRPLALSFVKSVPQDAPNNPILWAGLSRIAWMDLDSVINHSLTAATSRKLNRLSRSRESNTSTYKLIYFVEKNAERVWLGGTGHLSMRCFDLLKWLYWSVWNMTLCVDRKGPCQS